MTLIFGRANSKLIKLQNKTGKKLYTFSLLAGHSCVGAKDCLAHVVETPNGRKLIDGPDQKFRCFSASQEALFTNVYESRKKNFEQIKNCGNSVEKMTALIMESLPQDAEIIRVGVSGDYFSLNYMIAWCTVAKLNPCKHFYSYTKSIPIFLKTLKQGLIPKNFIFTMSRGGKFDNLIDDFKLKEAIVVFSEKEAKDKKLKIDYDDYKAAYGTKSFALLLHGQQKSNSAASKALSRLRKPVYDN